jgi:hypothetical protein
MLPVFVVILALIWYIWRYIWTRKSEQSVYDMDPVSASMILSEVNPAESAQVCIVNVIILDERIQFVDFRDQFIKSMIDSDPSTRFRHVIDCTGRYPRWKEASKNWHPYDNFSRVSEIQNMESLNGIVSRRLTEPLLISKPVWDVIFVEKFDSESGLVSAAVITMHHSMGDGFTLSQQIISRCTPAEPGSSMADCFPYQPKQHYHHGKRRGVVDLIQHYLRMIQKMITSAIKLLLMDKNPVGPLRMSRPRKLNDRIVSAITEIPFSVDQLKKISKAISLKLFAHTQSFSKYQP